MSVSVFYCPIRNVVFPCYFSKTQLFTIDCLIMALPTILCLQIVYSKTKEIAKSENRNTNSQIEYFVRKGVEAYEKEHGSISLPKDE